MLPLLTISTILACSVLQEGKGERKGKTRLYQSPLPAHSPCYGEAWQDRHFPMW